MPITVKALNPGFVAEISGIRLGDDLGDDVFNEIITAMDTYAIGVFPGQHLNDDEQLRFSARLGPLETTRRLLRPGAQLRLDKHIADISNLDVENQIVPEGGRALMNAIGNRLWHTDSSFKPTPAKYSLLSCHSIPAWGGDTQFADMRAAYDALEDRLKAKIEGLVADHSINYSRSTNGFSDFMPEEIQPAVPQTVVRVHPGSKRKTLYLASHAERIHGISLPEGRILLYDLMDHATQPQFTHTHHWQVGDLVIWDDRCTMHRARDYDVTTPRDMRRTTVSDVAPTIEQAKVA
jgi:alpha-ketoglutarate-dependent 2,4-dichlorophenoxyacetate dioxygenase